MELLAGMIYSALFVGAVYWVFTTDWEDKDD